jgi:hypothetical protein
MRKSLWLAAWVVLVSTRCLAQAQDAPITSPPPNIIVPNYNGVPTGPLGGLEGSAYVARAGDTSAPWFNPAGLSQAGTQLSGSVGNIQYTTITPQRLPDEGGSTQHLPNLVGATVKYKGITAGFALITTASWGAGLDSVYTLTNADGNHQRFAYSADSALSQSVTAGAIGYDLGPRWRVGAGVALTATSIRSNQIISDRIDAPDANRTLLFASRAGGSIDSIRGIFGVQFHPASPLRVGLVARTGGASYGRSGRFSLDSTLSGGGPTIGASIDDSSASFDYKLPFELSGGVAVVSKRAELEFDVLGYSSIAEYPLLSSTEPMTIYKDPGNGTRGTNTDRPFTPLMAAFHSVTNYTTGGHVLILQSPLPLTVHAGLGTDHSPVPTEDAAVFGQVDFRVVTIGLSGSIKKFSFALGANTRKGTIENLVLQNLITGPVQASLQVRTFGITYSLNYKF